MSSISTPSSKAQATANSRDRLIEAGRELFWQRGFNDVGLSEILGRASVPKGSFYHHFKSKEHFGLEVVKSFGEQAVQSLEEQVQMPGSHLSRLRSFFLNQRQNQAANGCQDGCLLGNLGQELANSSDVLRTSVKRYLKAFSDRIAACLAAAVAAGELPAETDPEKLASVVLSAWHGALLRMKVEKNPAPVDVFLEFYFPVRD